jgi:hypothetical protein
MVAVESRVARDLGIVAVFASIGDALTDPLSKLGRGRPSRHVLLGPDFGFARCRPSDGSVSLFDQ